RRMQHAVPQIEDGRIRTDTNRQRQHGDSGKTRRFHERPKRVLDVLTHRGGDQLRERIIKRYAMTTTRIPAICGVAPGAPAGSRMWLFAGGMGMFASERPNGTDNLF